MFEKDPRTEKNSTSCSETVSQGQLWASRVVCVVHSVFYKFEPVFFQCGIFVCFCIRLWLLSFSEQTALPPGSPPRTLRVPSPPPLPPLGPSTPPGGRAGQMGAVLLRPFSWADSAARRERFHSLYPIDCPPVGTPSALRGVQG